MWKQQPLQRHRVKSWSQQRKSKSFPIQVSISTILNRLSITGNSTCNCAINLSIRKTHELYSQDRQETNSDLFVFTDIAPVQLESNCCSSHVFLKGYCVESSALPRIFTAAPVISFMTSTLPGWHVQIKVKCVLCQVLGAVDKWRLVTFLKVSSRLCLAQYVIVSRTPYEETSLLVPSSQNDSKYAARI